MRRKTKSATLAAELDQLTAELPRAQQRLEAAFRTEPPGNVMKGDHLTRYLTEAQNVLDIVRRIKELEGTE
jgi:50S ribosomal subunit-associated GTPase HflX